MGGTIRAGVMANGGEGGKAGTAGLEKEFFSFQQMEKSCLVKIHLVFIYRGWVLTAPHPQQPWGISQAHCSPCSEHRV